MIKLIPLLVLFSSCAQFTIQDYKNVYQATFVKPDNEIVVSQEFIDLREYSFAKVEIGDDVSAILVLAFIKNDLFTWISSTGEKIVTKNGKIVETFGLKYNMKLLDSSQINLSESEFNVFIELDNPHAIIQNKLKISKDFSLNNGDSIDLYIENFSSFSSSFKWSGKNYYWVDTKTNLIKRTHQHIHPYQDSIEIEFFYK